MEMKHDIECNTCKFVANCSAIHIKGPMGSFNVTEPFTCISNIIVYGIIYTRCNIIYIGETGRRLAARITEHIRSIRNNFSGFHVAQHFNPPSHCSFNDFSVTGIIHCNCSNVIRLNIENRIVFKLGTLSPLGLSTKFDAFFPDVDLRHYFSTINCFHLRKGLYSKRR